MAVPSDGDKKTGETPEPNRRSLLRRARPQGSRAVGTSARRARMRLPPRRLASSSAGNTASALSSSTRPALMPPTRGPVSESVTSQTERRGPDLPDGTVSGRFRFMGLGRGKHQIESGPRCPPRRRCCNVPAERLELGRRERARRAGDAERHGTDERRRVSRRDGARFPCRAVAEGECLGPAGEAHPARRRSDVHLPARNGFGPRGGPEVSKTTIRTGPETMSPEARR